jgi:hypothetical protein
MQLNNLKSPKQIVEACPAMTMGGLRMLLFHSRTNGLESCVVRLGRKLLIDEVAFVRWLEELRARPPRTRVMPRPSVAASGGRGHRGKR